MAKAKQQKVKWALSGSEPDDLAEFKDNEQIVKENKGLPPKGVYRFKVKRLGVKPNKNGDDRINAMLIFDEPKKSKSATWNGYLMNDGFNIVEGDSLGFLKRFLKGLGLTWDDFMERSKEEVEGDKKKGDQKRTIVQIGKIKFGPDAGKDPHVNVLIKHAPPDGYNDEEFLKPVRYIPADDAADDDASGDDAVDMSADDDKAAKKAAKRKDKKDSLSQESLNAMKAKDLIALAGKHEVKQKKIDKAGKDKAALVAMLTKELNLPPF